MWGDDKDFQYIDLFLTSLPFIQISAPSPSSFPEKSSKLKNVPLSALTLYGVLQRERWIWWKHTKKSLICIWKVRLLLWKKEADQSSTWSLMEREKKMLQKAHFPPLTMRGRAIRVAILHECKEKKRDERSHFHHILAMSLAEFSSSSFLSKFIRRRLFLPWELSLKFAIDPLKITWNANVLLPAQAKSTKDLSERFLLLALTSFLCLLLALALRHRQFIKASKAKTSSSPWALDNTHH